MTDLKIHQKINLKDLYQVLYIDFIVSGWKKNICNVIFIHSLVLYDCAVSFIALLGKRPQVECYMLLRSA